MSRVHILDGKSLAVAVRSIQNQSILWYEDEASRNADIPVPWDGATTLFPLSDGTLVVESNYGGVWHRQQSGGGGGGGVTDHGALTGLGDDDHPQYLTAARGDALFLTPAEGDLMYVNVGGDTMTGDLVLPRDPTADSQASTKHYVDTQDAAHVVAANPHPAYLTPSEVVGGSNIGVTVPGDGTVVISGQPAASGEWNWVTAAMTTDPGVGNIAANSADGTVATSIVVNKTTATGLGAVWLGAMTSGDGIVIAAAAAVNGFLRYVVVGSSQDRGTFWLFPVAAVPVTGTIEPPNATRVRMWVGIGSGGGATGGISQGDADVRYVNVLGDTMTGSLNINSGAASTSVLSAGRVDIKDMSPGSSSYATERIYHDNNVDHMAIGIPNTDVPGLEITDSRDPSTVLMRIARSEPVTIPVNGLTVHGAVIADSNVTAAGTVQGGSVMATGAVTAGTVVTGIRVDVKDPIAGTGGYATQRMYHDNNTDHMALSVLATATPGFEVSDSRGGGALLRVAKDEKVSFPQLGHQHRNYVRGLFQGDTPVTTWTQLRLGTTNLQGGNLLWQQNPGGIYLYEAGFYIVSGMIMADRPLANVSLSTKFVGTTLATFGTEGTETSRWVQRYPYNLTFWAWQAGWLTFEAQTDTPTWLGGTSESWIMVISQF